MPLLVSLQENKIDEESFQPSSIDLVCLIDCSGSMEGHKLLEVKKSLLYMLQLMSPEDRIAIVAFNSDSIILNSFRSCTPENISGRLRHNIKRLTASGGTNIVGGLKRALKLLIRRKRSNMVSSIFLLSDGNDNFELYGLKSVLKEYGKAAGDFSLSCFGYGDDHNPEMLIDLSSKRGGGSFYYVNEMISVDEAFVDSLALLKSQIGVNATIELHYSGSPSIPEGERT